MSADAGATVSLGDVSVDLSVTVRPSSEVDCTLAFRGVTVSFVFAGDGSLGAVRLPGGASPMIESRF